MTATCSLRWRVATCNMRALPHIAHVHHRLANASPDREQHSVAVKELARDDMPLFKDEEGEGVKPNGITLDTFKGSGVRSCILLGQGERRVDSAGVVARLTHSRRHCLLSNYLRH